MRTLPEVQKSIVIINDVFFFFSLLKDSKLTALDSIPKMASTCQICGKLVGNVLCASFSPFTKYRRKLQAHRCVFFSAALMGFFRCILRSSIPQGRSFPHLAQSWSLCCCPFDLERKILRVMCNFDFPIIKIVV